MRGTLVSKAKINLRLNSVCFLSQNFFKIAIHQPAAGMVIVEESGGFISDFDGERATILTRDMIISCNEGNSKHNLSKAILQVLKENDCVQYK